MERDLCVNCDHWREEHYSQSGVWTGDKINCSEYMGSVPSHERFAKKVSEIAAAKKKLHG